MQHKRSAVQASAIWTDVFYRTDATTVLAHLRLTTRIELASSQTGRLHGSSCRNVHLARRVDEHRASVNKDAMQALPGNRSLLNRCLSATFAERLAFQVQVVDRKAP